MCSTLRSTWVALCLLAPLAASAQPIVGLGHLPGAPAENPYSAAFGVSADGTTVVGESDSNADADAETIELQAFRWTQSGGIQALGDLPGGAFDSVANGVSPDGSVVVGGSQTGTAFVGFRWTEATGMQALPGQSGRSSSANGVSSDGRFLVGLREENDFDDAASSWTVDEMGDITTAFLPDLPGGIQNGLAWATSADGSVTVGYTSSSASGDNATEATRWTSGGAAGLGDLSGGGVDSDARGVSADGSVVAGVGLTGTGYNAFRWTQAGGMVSLGEFPGGDVYSEAFAISADGTTIVGDSALEGGVHAFIWDAVNGMRDLHELVDADAQGWTLYAASGVSADGTVIVGEGRNPQGEREAWLVDLPEPGGALASLAATGALAGLSRRRPRES